MLTFNWESFLCRIVLFTAGPVLNQASNLCLTALVHICEHIWSYSNAVAVRIRNMLFYCVRVASVKAYTCTHMQIFTHPHNEPTDKTAYRRTVCSWALHQYVDMYVCVFLGKHTHDNNSKNQTEPKGWACSHVALLFDLWTLDTKQLTWSVTDPVV